MSNQTRGGKDSRFGERFLSEIYEEIRMLYLSDNRPWVIGFSGGKDSTAALQLVWYALESLSPAKRHKPVYIISSDTLVETPVVVEQINSSLREIKVAAKHLNLPFYPNKIKPEITQSYWVNLIGRGYPVPYSRSRWCTDRLKIAPANRFILDKVAQYGEVILLLGVRKSESVTRAQVINLRTIEGTLLKRHTSLAGAFVYAPIVDFSTNDVWNYLLNTPSPWGGENGNKYLFDLYQSANSDECPLVIDNTTPTCGNSRFGCWVCTLVKKDHSMESLIQSGEKWMMPLLEFRNFLSSLNEPAQKQKYRDHRRRDGKVYFKKDSKEIALGQTRISKGLPQILLRKVLETQLAVQKHDPNLVLISEPELHEIRRLWRTEQSDWLDQVPTIYNEVTGEQLDWAQDDIGVFGKEEKEILAKICKETDVPTEMVMELLDLEKEFHGMSRRTNIYKRIDKVFKKEWRSHEEISA